MLDERSRTKDADLTGSCAPGATAQYGLGIATQILEPKGRQSSRPWITRCNGSPSGEHPANFGATKYRRSRPHAEREPCRGSDRLSARNRR